MIYQRIGYNFVCLFIVSGLGAKLEPQSSISRESAWIFHAQNDQHIIHDLMYSIL